MEPVSADLPNPSSSTLPPTLPELTNRSRHPKKRLAILLLIFFGLMISSVAGFLYLESPDRAQKRLLLNAQEWRNKFTTPSVQPVYFAPSPLTNDKLISPSVSSSPTLTPEATTLIDLPFLFPELCWIKIVGNNFEDINKLYVTSDDYTLFSEEVGLKSQGWVAKKENLSEKELLDVSEKFRLFYGSEFEKLNWKWQASIPNYKFMTIVADGPNGSAWGLIGVRENNLRVITLSESRSGIGFENCPCAITFEVYLSEIYPIAKVISSVEK